MFMSFPDLKRPCAFGLLAVAALGGCARLETVPVVGRFLPRPSAGVAAVDPAIGTTLGTDHYAEMLARGHDQAGLAKAPPAAKPDPKPEAEKSPKPLPAAPDLVSPPDDGVPAPLPPLVEPATSAPAAGFDAAELIRPQIEAARARIRTLNTYQVKLTRQERVGGQLLPREDVLVGIRREPRAARITWVDGPHKGREVIYRADEPTLLNVHMGDIAIPLTLRVPVDGPRVRESSRHPITEVGLEGVLDQLAGQVDRAKAEGDTLSIDEPAQVAGVAAPTRKVARTTRSGERWSVLMDAETSVPVLVEGFGADGLLLEHYRFADLVAEPAELAAAEAFDPALRWPKVGGLFQRISRTAP